MAQQNRWDIARWKAGPVSIPEALGLPPRIRTAIRYPSLNASLQQQAVAARNPAQGASGSGVPTPGSIGPCNSAQTVANQRLGQQLAQPYGWQSGTEWSAINSIAFAESGWCNTAQNPTSTAYGIGQFLNTTWSDVGGTKTSDPRTQIQLMYKYIKQRYGTPQNAWAFHLSHGWY